MTAEETVRLIKTILAAPGWQGVEVRETPAFWTIIGFYHGRFHSGWRSDAVALAHSLDAIAKAEHETPLVPEVVVVEATPPPANPNTIPEELAPYAETWESATDFKGRVKTLWQRFGIEDGKHFPGGGEALTAEEKILMREIDIANQKAGNWLSV